LVKSRAGCLWSDSETLKGAQREHFKVLRKLDEANLGEGAGYKILERSSLLYGVEHFMLALLMERGQAVPQRSRVMLAALNPTIRDTILRLNLPFVGREKLQAQIMAERSEGYVCVSLHGTLLEANQRAHDLMTRYQDAARVQGRRRAVTEFAERAREEASGGQLWILPAIEPGSSLQVSTHRLLKEAYDLPEDVILVVMEEVVPRSPAEEPALLEPLTPREWEVAHLIVTTGYGEKQIADTLGIKMATVTKHTENIRWKAQCHSRPELTVRLKRLVFT
jgi:ATP/maltotriose-dependent transcriptional regulator MalT